MDMQELMQRRQEIVDAAHHLAQRGLVEGSAGNISCRFGEHYLVTATGARFTTITTDQVPLVDRDGNVIDGDVKPTSEMQMHISVYDETSAKAVVHTHSPYATALSLVLDEVPLIHYTQLTLGGSIKMVPYATFGTKKLADLVKKKILGQKGVILRGHGTICSGKDVAAAAENAELLEWVCKVYHIASQHGTPREMKPGEVVGVAAAATLKSYGTVQKSK
ncbi:MAG: class II aldolase/adducin family protein [Lawsonella sp.]|nr:class II aldolase/adducin family protein [Mycobacteriales bacterium]